MATAFKLDEDLRARVARIADRRGQSADAVLREAVGSFVTRAEARESFLQKAVDSEDHFERTGLHITLEELEDWLDSWGTENEKAMPDCHE